MTDALKVLSFLAGYIAACILTPWAIIIGIIAMFAYFMYTGGYI